MTEENKQETKAAKGPVGGAKPEKKNGSPRRRKIFRPRTQPDSLPARENAGNVLTGEKRIKPVPETGKTKMSEKAVSNPENKENKESKRQLSRQTSAQKAIEKAKTEYEKYQVKELSPIEKEYLNSINKINQIAESLDKK